MRRSASNSSTSDRFLGMLDAETAQLRGGVVLPLEDKTSTCEVEVEAISGSQAQRRPDLGGHDQTTLLAERQSAIHMAIVPRVAQLCQMLNAAGAVIRSVTL